MKWTYLETKILTDMVLKGLKKGEPLHTIFENASKNLTKGVQAVKSQYYDYILPKHESAINPLINIGSSGFNERWTRKEDVILINAIGYAIRNNKSIDGAIKGAALKLKRTYKSCEGRWYSEVSLMGEVKAYVTSCRKKAL